MRIFLPFMLAVVLLCILGRNSVGYAAGREDNNPPSAARSEHAQPPDQRLHPCPVYTYKVVHAYPHDPQAFTQGLVFAEGFFYEGTGGYGKSSIRKVSQSTGTVLQLRNLSEQHFGEGVTLFGDDLIQLTWRSHQGFVYEKATFEIKRVFSYPGEGWGITTDGARLIMSDGTSTLHFLDPKTFEVTGHLAVADSNGPVTMLNELEYVRGELYANIWGTARIAVISPFTGMVEQWVDLQGLWKEVSKEAEVDVPNGIAFDPAGNRLFVTGKLWPRVFEIELVPPAAAAPVPEGFPHN